MDIDKSFLAEIFFNLPSFKFFSGTYDNDFSIAKECLVILPIPGGIFNSNFVFPGNLKKGA